MLADVALAFVLAVGPVFIFGLSGYGMDAPAPRLPRLFGRDLLALIVGAQILGVALRRRYVVPAFWLVVAACVLQLLVLGEPVYSDLAVPVAAYSLARWGPSVRARYLGLIPVVLSGPLALRDWAPGTDLRTAAVQLAVFSAIPLLAWGWGDLNRRRAEVLTDLAAQNAALLRDRAQREQLAAQAERTRIAREMHDIVAHSLSVIVVQAQGGAYAAAHAPVWERGAAQQVLDTVSATAREALAETRRLVGVLREEGDGAAEYLPAQGIDDIAALVANIRAAGIPADLEVIGEAPVPREVGAAAYRIVQEALTNVLKHAGPGARVWVRLDRRDGVALSVEDDGHGDRAEVNAGQSAAERGSVAGPGGPASTRVLGTGPGVAPGHGQAPGPGQAAGNGLIGMRERAASVGGSVSAGPLPGGGWRVTARLPAGQ